MAGVHRVLVLSDLHVGGTSAICPRGYTTIEDTLILPNKLQCWMLDRFGELVEYVQERRRAGDKWTLILNGDMIEGVHHRTTQVWSNDAADHVGAAWMLLQPLAEECKTVYMVRGTEAHTGTAAENTLANLLGAVPYKKNQPAFDRLDVKIEGIPCRFTHHMPTTSRMHLEASAHSIMYVNHLANTVRAGKAPPRVLCMAHRHVPGTFSDGHYVTLVTPSWQALTRFGHKVAGAGETWVGAGELTFDRPGELPACRLIVHCAPEHLA